MKMADLLILKVHLFALILFTDDSKTSDDPILVLPNCLRKSTYPSVKNLLDLSDLQRQLSSILWIGRSGTTYFWCVNLPWCLIVNCVLQTITGLVTFGDIVLFVLGTAVIVEISEDK